MTMLNASMIIAGQNQEIVCGCNHMRFGMNLPLTYSMYWGYFFSMQHSLFSSINTPNTIIGTITAANNSLSMVQTPLPNRIRRIKPACIGCLIQRQTPSLISLFYLVAQQGVISKYFSFKRLESLKGIIIFSPTSLIESKQRYKPTRLIGMHTQDEIVKRYINEGLKLPTMYHNMIPLRMLQMYLSYSEKYGLFAEKVTLNLRVAITMCCAQNNRQRHML